MTNQEDQEDQEIKSESCHYQLTNDTRLDADDRDFRHHAGIDIY